MDTLRNSFGASGDMSGDDVAEDEAVNDGPPPEIGRDERRMQVRAYNFWASLLEHRNFPSIEDLDPEALPDFGPHSVLLDFSLGAENPGISFLGEKLAAECGAGGLEISTLNDVPSRSLLSRITDHYMQIIANQAPIGFEAEFVNQRGLTILYRGILLPFSSDDDTIDFIYGVINWKELADSQAADELLLEIDQALAMPANAPGRSMQAITDWADGPAMLPAADNAAGSGTEWPMPEAYEDGADTPDLVAAVQHPQPAAMELADWLASAREKAQAARSSEDRTRAALYQAIGHAYDFSLAAAQAPQDFAEILEDAGLKAQERAPMTPVVKLVFGVDYDKTRLTEYAAALGHAQRMGLQAGALGEYLRAADGGLKGVVETERRLRREESGRTSGGTSGGASGEKTGAPRKAIARKLRALAPQSFASIAPEGSEFALVMIRRSETGDLAVLGEVPEDRQMIEKAARQLFG